jgi:hypothetical protein
VSFVSTDLGILTFTEICILPLDTVFKGEHAEKPRKISKRINTVKE